MSILESDVKVVDEIIAGNIRWVLVTISQVEDIFSEVGALLEELLPSSRTLHRGQITQHQTRYFRWQQDIHVELDVDDSNDEILATAI